MFDYFHDLQTWWFDLAPETHARIRAAGLLLGALVAGHFLGKLTARKLRARQFDAALCVPGSAPPSVDSDGGITPSFLCSMLVRLTVWAWPVWWLAGQQGNTEFAGRLGLIISRSWALAGVLIVTLALGGLLTRRLAEFLHGAKPTGDSPALRGGTSAPRNGVVDGVAAGVYLLIALLVLLIAADMFDWPLTRNSVQALWQFAQKLLTVAATLVIGLLGARWARELVVEPAPTSEKRAGQLTGLGIVAISTVMSLGVLLSNASLALGVAVLAGLGTALWLGRGYLPDIAAGLQLRAQKVPEVWFEGAAWQLVNIGLVTAQVCRDGAVHRVKNRTVLDAQMHAAPQELATPQ